MKRILRVLLLAATAITAATTTSALGQVSPEEAQRRLDERRAQAATRPLDVSVIPDLKFQIATLQREIARLKAENAVLAKRLADAEAAASTAATSTANANATAPTTGPARDAGQSEPASPTTMASAAKPSGKLRLGMTLEEANAAMGFAGKLVGEGRGWQQYEWQLPGKARPGDAPTASDSRHTLLGGGGDNAPAGPSIFARFEGGSLTSYAKR